MRKDIELRKVEDVAIAILPKDDESDELWDVYLINLKDKELKSVLVNSKGYGNRDGEKVMTGTFRYFVESLPAYSAVMIEPVQSSLFDIVHEFFVTFSMDDYLYDKKYIFVEGSIHSMNFTQIPILERKGVMIK